MTVGSIVNAPQFDQRKTHIEEERVTQSTLKEEQKKPQKAEEADFSDPVVAFEEVAKTALPMIIDDLQARLFASNPTREMVVDRALILREQNAKLLSEDGVEEAIRWQNIMLASKGEPPMKPAEEQLFSSKVLTMSREKVSFLDSFLGLTGGNFLEAVG